MPGKRGGPSHKGGFSEIDVSASEKRRPHKNPDDARSAALV
jgi:hypothetical protein